MVTLIVRRGDHGTLTRLAQELSDARHIQVIEERRISSRPDRRARPMMREMDRRRLRSTGGGDRRAPVAALRFQGVIA